jgi:DNA/RNA-binding domain of Phe-tRNA-synthetase-like protein
MKIMRFVNEIPSGNVELVVIEARNVNPDHYPENLSREMDDWIEKRKTPLSPDEDAVRKAARDMLRNGRYKPTGRGKPASEYLLRAALEESERPFPRINALVDINNLVSLQFVLPASLWDIDLSESDHFHFGLGGSGERYVFNETGQEIDLEDLVVGYARSGRNILVPIVNPIKDSMRTKTNANTRNVAAVIYVPSPYFNSESIDGMRGRFADLLQGCGSDVDVASGVIKPSESISIA